MSRAGSYGIWRILLLAQIREQPTRFLVTVMALALGVALGSSVYLVNTLCSSMNSAWPPNDWLARPTSWCAVRAKVFPNRCSWIWRAMCR